MFPVSSYTSAFRMLAPSHSRPCSSAIFYPSDLFSIGMLLFVLTVNVIRYFVSMNKFYTRIKTKQVINVHFEIDSSQ